jgi:AhpD family alkylhydroperoxidase
MSAYELIEYEASTGEVRRVYDEIRALRKTDYINNFWKALAHDPVTLRRTWDSVQQVMGAGALDPLTKELIYIAVSVANGCAYCVASHSRAAVAKGMTPEMFGELQAVIGMASETNRLAVGWRVPVDERFEAPLPR